jgi:hypothetical protein
MFKELPSFFVSTMKPLLNQPFIASKPLNGRAEGGCGTKSYPFEDYATIETYAGGAPIYSFSPMSYVYGISPEM